MSERPPAPNVGAALTWAFSQMRRHTVAYLALAAVVTVILFAQGVASRPIQEAVLACSNPQSPGQQAACTTAAGSGLLVTAGVFFAFVILGWLASIGVRRAAVQATHGVLPTFTQMVTTQYLGRYVLFSLLQGVIIALGLVLCIVPGIVAFVAFQLGPYLVLDRGERPMRALAISARAIRAHPGPGIALGAITLAASLLGGVAFGLPTLIVLPFSCLFSAHMYRQFMGDGPDQIAD